MCLVRSNRIRLDPVVVPVGNRMEWPITLETLGNKSPIHAIKEHGSYSVMKQIGSDIPIIPVKRKRAITLRT